MAILIIGVVLIIGAVGCVSIALSPGGSTTRISKERIASFTATEEKSLLTRLTDGALVQVERLMSRRGWRPFTAAELELAGITMPVASLVVVVSAVALAAFAAGLLLIQVWFIGLLMGVLAVIGAKQYIKFRAGRRRKKFTNQLPQMLQMMASSLRAGHGLSRAMDAVARDASSPMREEMSRVVNENRLGRDLVPALEDVAERMESKDFGWVAAAIGVQRETGGNLNEILDQVAETIRERNQIRQQVSALSAEGRLSAYILMALPVGIGGYYAMVNPVAFNTFLDAGIGKMLVAGSITLYTLGGFWMRSIVRIEF